MQNILNLKNIILQIIFTTDLKRMPTWECYAIQLLIKQLTHESWNYQTSVKMFPRSTKCIVRVAPNIPLRSDFWMEIIGAPKVRYLHHYAVNKCMRRVCAREREVTCVSKVGETGGVCYWEALSRLPASNVTVAVCVSSLGVCAASSTTHNSARRGKGRERQAGCAPSPFLSALDQAACASSAFWVVVSLERSSLRRWPTLKGQRREVYWQNAPRSVQALSTQKKWR